MKDILNLNESEKNRIRGLHGMQQINEDKLNILQKFDKFIQSTSMKNLAKKLANPNISMEDWKKALKAYRHAKGRVEDLEGITPEDYTKYKLNTEAETVIPEIEENVGMSMTEKGEVEEVEQYLNEKGLKIDKGEGRMAKHDTMELVNDAKEVSDMIQDDMDLPEWVESKITIAAENLNTVRDYISHHILGIHK